MLYIGRMELRSRDQVRVAYLLFRIGLRDQRGMLVRIRGTVSRSSAAFTITCWVDPIFMLSIQWNLRLRRQESPYRSPHGMREIELL